MWDCMGWSTSGTTGHAPRYTVHERALYFNSTFLSNHPVSLLPFFPAHHRTTQLEIRSRTTERGFQGVMARWGFKGGPQRYGPKRSKAWHRRGGSTNTSEAWGRTPKGAKMPGHMGGLMRTNTIFLHRVDIKNQLLYVSGRIPGPLGSMVSLCDTKVRKFDYFFGAPPFPTFAPAEEEDVSAMSWTDAQLVGRSRIGFPVELGHMPAPGLLDNYNYAQKQKEIMAAETIRLQSQS